MFSHVMVGTNDLEKSKKFYDALFKSLGGREAIVDPKGRLIYLHNGGTFLVTPPIDGDAWHKAGIEAGGKAIEDPPGWREGGGMKLYLAYLRDPDGNKICTMLRG